MTKAVPDDQKGLIEIKFIDLPSRKGYKYVKGTKIIIIHFEFLVKAGSYKRTGKGYTRSLAIQYACKKLVDFVERKQQQEEKEQEEQEREQ